MVATKDKDSTWDTREADAARGGRGGAARPLVWRLIRVLDYDDLRAGGGPVIDLDGVSSVLIGGGAPAITPKTTNGGRREIDVRIEDRYLSQSHVRLDLAEERTTTTATAVATTTGDSQISITDLGSRNGTRVVGGEPIAANGPPRALADGDWFETGHTVWMVRRAPRGSPLDVEIGPTRSYSPLLCALGERLDRLAGSVVPLVISGPTGSGKEIVAQHVHRQSKRRGEFVGVNCGAIVGSLLESELFGHRRGAFTGATSDRRGFVETAHGGTLFLDEVSELSLSAQVRLLRVLELGEVVPVGGVSPTKVDLRILSASNRDLEDLADEGAFRPDLYARLAGYVLVLPPLAARKEDLGELIAHFIKSAGGGAAKAGAGRVDAAGRAGGAGEDNDDDDRSPAIDSAAGRALVLDAWSLNVRGLRRAIESALALAHDRPIGLDDLPQRLRTGSSTSSSSSSPSSASASPAAAPPPPVPRELNEVDTKLREEVIAALAAESGNVTRAAERMGKHRQQFQRWMRRLGVERS